MPHYPTRALAGWNYLGVLTLLAFTFLVGGSGIFTVNLAFIRAKRLRSASSTLLYPYVKHNTAHLGYSSVLLPDRQ